MKKILLLLINILLITHIFAEDNIKSEAIKPNEVGKIMVLLYHDFEDYRFFSSYSYNTTFKKFKSDLEYLYKNNYIPISKNELLTGNFNVPKGKTPVLLTFDDGTKTQVSFNLKDNKLILKENTMAYIFLEFSKQHPEFPLHGLIFINKNPFPGDGTVNQRIVETLNLGFDIGNHTWSHKKLNKLTTEKMQEEFGKIQELLNEAKPGYILNVASMPFGIPYGQDTEQFVYKGNYNNISYENRIVFKSGASPIESPYNIKYRSLRLPRILASSATWRDNTSENIEKWFKYFEDHPEERFVSDGISDTVTIPKELEQEIDKKKLNGKNLVIY